MSGHGTIAVTLTSIRVASYLLLGYAVFYLAMALGKWYEGEVMTDELEFTLNGDLEIRSSYTQRFFFIALPIVLAASLGGVYEAIWKYREVNSHKRNHGASMGEEAGGDTRSPGVFALLNKVVHYKFWPLGRYAPCLTVGESFVLLVWIVAMGAQCWQGNMNHGNHFYDIHARCLDDPSKWCHNYTGEVGPTPKQYRLKMIAIFMGLVASSHFAIILVPVSRDSKILAAIGVPFERAVLYHVIAGHLTFIALFMHAFLFIVYWVWFDGWDYAWHESVHVDPNTHGGVDTPMGWMAGLCGIPMWITSLNYVRRRWYSLFKLGHWLFLGVFIFSVMHWAPNTLYFLGGLVLYTMHVMSRLSSWKRWRYWNRWWNPAEEASPTSLVHALATDKYTRLVLRNPKAEFSRGGSFVYLAVPGALGTDEAHAITVALRGAPPTLTSLGKTNASPQEDVFTVYVKDLGPWTRALKLVASGAAATSSPKSLLVDVDGFYNHVDSFNSMMKGGASRMVVIAGGSGITSVMGFIQDWCVAAAEGASVPTVHLAWCCRDISEMELVGEALPSMLASAGRVKDTHFVLSLYCSKAKDTGVPLTVTWPLDSTAYANKSTKEHVFGTSSAAASLNYSVRVVLAGGAAYAGFLLGMYEVDRRDMMDLYHEGAIIFVLQIVCIVGALIVYGWISCLVREHLWQSVPNNKKSPMEESKMDPEEPSGHSVTYTVQHGRVPTTTVLTQEAELAEKSGVHSVKVLVSGPTALVDSVLAEARAINWKLFDTEAFSFEF